MNILHINTLDIGGASNACLRLHKTLLLRRISSHLLIKHKTRTLPFSSTYVSEVPLLKKINILIQIVLLKTGLFPLKWIDRKSSIIYQRNDGMEYYSFPTSDIDITDTEEYKRADIIHLHWVADFLDWESFFKKNKKPIVWTLHDENPYLGGEHYSGKNIGINSDGTLIKGDINEWMYAEDLKIFEFKKKCVKDVIGITVVCPSRWIMNLSENSQILGKFKHVNIPNGVLPEDYKVLDREFCRTVLGIPMSKTVLLFVSDSVKRIIKGYSILKTAVGMLPHYISENTVFLVVGANSGLNSISNILELGRIHDDKMMSIIYNAADFFILPSLEDNFPNTMIESIMCGTPVLGFPVGGIPEAIKHEFNGLLCRSTSVESLLETLVLAINGQFEFDRLQIAKDAKIRFSSEVQADAYIKLYKNILDEQSLTK